MLECSESTPFSRATRLLASWLLTAALLLPGSTALGLGFTLDVEFDTGLTGAFADVEVFEEAMGLRFEIALLEALGPAADLHEFYFNLEDGAPDLQIESDDDVTTAYVLAQAPPVAGGAGSNFDYGVNFGDGAGPPGNGVLQFASFLISPIDSSLSLTLDMFLNGEMSSAAGGSILANTAVHVQGTSLVIGSDSETVGGVVPEPSTGLLVAGGLLLGARRGPKRSGQRAIA